MARRPDSDQSFSRRKPVVVSSFCVVYWQKAHYLDIFQLQHTISCGGEYEAKAYQRLVHRLNISPNALRRFGCAGMGESVAVTSAAAVFATTEGTSPP
ncbi:MAG: hypothetical protein JWQ49_1477 [Edaphobacter sp.]|nr:hypothetical protein [Edaphobacter sp.]